MFTGVHGIDVTVVVASVVVVVDVVVEVVGVVVDVEVVGVVVVTVVVIFSSQCTPVYPKKVINM